MIMETPGPLKLLCLMFIIKEAISQDSSAAPLSSIRVDKAKVILGEKGSSDTSPSVEITWVAMEDIEWKEFRATLTSVRNKKIHASSTVSSTMRNVTVAGLSRGEKYNVSVEGWQWESTKSIVAKLPGGVVVDPSPAVIAKFRPLPRQKRMALVVVKTDTSSVWGQIMVTLYDTKGLSTRQTVNYNESRFPINFYFRELSDGEIYTASAVAVSYGMNSTVSHSANSVTIKPSTPNITSVSLLPPASLSVTWQADDSRRNGFEISSEASGKMTTSTNATSEQRQIALTHCIPGESYVISMVAWAGNVRSGSSVYSEAVTIPPSPPIIQRVTSSEATIINVAWMAGIGRCQLFYVKAVSADQTANVTHAYRPRVCQGHKTYDTDIDYLKPGTVYTASVKTMSYDKNSTSAVYTQYIQTKPAAPEISKIEQINDTITIKYIVDGNANYVNCIYVTTLGHQQLSPNVNVSEDIVLRSLWRGYRYNITLTSHLGDQSSEPSDLQRVTVAPSAPTITSLHETYNQSLVLKWTKGPGRVDYFNVFVTRTPQTTRIPYDPNRLDYVLIKMRLTRGQRYKIVLWANSYDKASTKVHDKLVIAPNKPTFEVNSVTSLSFSLVWKHVGLVHSFHIYYREITDENPRTTSVGPIDRSYLYKTVKTSYPGMTYSVWMSAESFGRSSGNTSSTFITLRPATPRNFRVTPRSGGFRSTWTQRGRATSFLFQITPDADPSSPLKLSYKPQKLQETYSYKYVPLKPGSYKVVIMARVSDQESGWTSPSYVTVAPVRVNITKEVTSDSVMIHLSWLNPNYKVMYLVILNSSDSCIHSITLDFGFKFKLSEPHRCRNKQFVSYKPGSLFASVNVSNLLPDTLYTLHLHVYESSDTDFKLDPTDFTTLVSVPTVTRVHNITSINTTEMTVCWTRPHPCPGHGDKTSYRLNVVDQEPESKQQHGTVFEYNLTGYLNTCLQVISLRPFWHYQFHVSAKTSAGTGPTSASNITQTLPGVPGSVWLFSATRKSVDVGHVSLKWLAPVKEDRHANITEFIITSLQQQMEAAGQEAEDHVTKLMVNVDSTNINEEFYAQIPILAEHHYTFSVYAVSDSRVKGPKQQQSMSIFASAPAAPTRAIVTPVSVRLKEPTTSFAIQIHTNFFRDSHRGRIIRSGLIAARDTPAGRSRRGMLRVDYDSYHNWNWAVQNDMQPYRVTGRNWARRIRNKKKVVFIVGFDLECDQQNAVRFCNGVLESGQVYQVKAFACTVRACTETPFYRGFRTQVVPSSTNLGVILGILMALSFIAIIIITVIYFRRRRHKNAAHKMVESTSSTPTEPLMETEMSEIPTHLPIELANLEARVAAMHADSDLLFNQEYNWIRQHTNEELTTYAGKDPANKAKNRYADILPYDKTRVELTCLGEDPSTQYINANYISGRNSSSGYIAAQGPQTATVDDFVRMVWEQDIVVIVMLTQCIENGTLKCEPYWPDKVGEEKMFGGVTIKLTSVLPTTLFELRHLEFMCEGMSRDVKQFHYSSWLDHSVSDTDAILDFIEEVNAHAASQNHGLVLVHCSAGVGRTGTYIAVDRLREHIMNELCTSIDVYSLVLSLRTQRPKMVQTEGQYALIHDCAVNIVKRKEHMEACIYGNELMYADNRYLDTEPLYENQAGAEQRTEL